MGKISAADWYRSGRRNGGNKFEGRKGLIARAARTCLERKGVAKTSIADITREVDITRELFYYYYPNKDSVVEAVLDSYVADAHALLVKGVQAVEDEPEALLLQVVHILRVWMSTDDSAAVPMLTSASAGSGLRYSSSGLSPFCFAILSQPEFAIFIYHDLGNM